jgi:mannitol-1-phosphate 5-dehydrogenase
MRKKKLLIYGAGAIGRGFVPWVFPPDLYTYTYVEANESLRDSLIQKMAFTSYLAMEGKYETLNVSVEGCLEPGDEFGLVSEFDGVITAVGPRNFPTLRASLAGTSLPVLCCENDSRLSEQMRQWSGNQNIVFAIPDVIASSSASPELLDADPLSIITENGVCFVDENFQPHLPGNAEYISSAALRHQWLAKLYIHNTPHCIAAYLGRILKCSFIHETMQDSYVYTVLSGVMDELGRMLTRTTDIDPYFLRFYRDKEMKRFSNQLLFDPIARVAREPFRKLERQDRLLGAAQRCLVAGVIPENIMRGILAAFCYESDDDPDSHIRYLIKSMDPKQFLRVIINLQDDDALFILLLERWSGIMGELEALRK